MLNEFSDSLHLHYPNIHIYIYIYIYIHIHAYIHNAIQKSKEYISTFTYFHISSGHVPRYNYLAI